jgi:methyl-accepting chemotaxis protein
MNMTSSVNSTETKDGRFGFWGNLPLSRKLLLAFGALFVFGLVIAASGLFGLNRVQGAYEDTLAGGIEIRFRSNHLNSTLLEARRREKDFLLRWQAEGFETAYDNYVLPNLQHTAEMKATLKELEGLAPVVGQSTLADYSQEQYETDLATLNEEILTYERSFASVVDLIEQRGFVDTGLEGEFRVAVQTIEERVLGIEDQLTITMLQIRRREKDYLLRGDQEYVDNVHELLDQLKGQVTALSSLNAAEKNEIRALADEYLTKFDELVQKDKEIAAATEVFRAAASEIQGDAAQLGDLGVQLAEQDVQTAQANSAQTLVLTAFTVFVVLALSIVLALTLSRQITRPVVQLTNTATEIATGKFDVQAEVSSGD